MYDIISFMSRFKSRLKMISVYSLYQQFIPGFMCLYCFSSPLGIFNSSGRNYNAVKSVSCKKMKNENCKRNIERSQNVCSNKCAVGYAVKYKCPYTPRSLNGDSMLRAVCDCVYTRCVCRSI